MTVYNARSHPTLIKTVADTTLEGIERFWGPDFLAALLKDAQFFDIHISNTAPVTTRLWFDPGNPATDVAGQMKVWDGAAWVNLTQALFMDWLSDRMGTSVSIGMNTDGRIYLSNNTSGYVDISDPFTYNNAGTLAYFERSFNIAQQLSLSGTNLSLSKGGNTVDLSSILAGSTTTDAIPFAAGEMAVNAPGPIPPAPSTALIHFQGCTTNNWSPPVGGGDAVLDTGGVVLTFSTARANTNYFSIGKGAVRALNPDGPFDGSGDPYYIPFNVLALNKTVNGCILSFHGELPGFNNPVASTGNRIVAVTPNCYNLASWPAGAIGAIGGVVFHLRFALYDYSSQNAN